MPHQLSFSAGATALVLAAAAQPAALAQDTEPDSSGPWRLGPALGTPDWFEIGGTFRTRFENFDEQFRASGSGQAHGFFTRTLLAMTLRDRFLRASVEVQDSRVYSGVSDAPLNTGIVNAAEFLQAHVGAEFTDAFQTGDKLDVLFGRHTMDLGGRRLTARNRFRNTINSFNGVNATWTDGDGALVRTFYTHPVQRLPNGQGPLEDNEVEADEERTSVRYWGAFTSVPDVAAGTDAEFYFLRLDEQDATDLNTRDRDIDTLGTRWNRKPSAGELHWEIEGAYQFGERAALDVEAYFAHLTFGYTFEDDIKSRLELLFDYVTGDDDPTDGDFNRFDTLFGARRFEFGPTGIFGAFARANLVSPGLRYSFFPGDRWQVMLAHRQHFLESDRDAWTTSGLVDATGAAGDQIGSLSEIRIRYDVEPKSLRLEFGVAHFAAGDFVDDAPNATTQGDSLYGYVQTNFTF
ncbi:MAG: alginate export family protein [Planctomycetota bacterium]